MPDPKTYQTGSAAKPVMTWQWPCQAQCVGLARAQLRKALAGWGLAGLEEPAVLVISELVTNAIQHARMPAGEMIRTRFVREDSGVRLEVYDTGMQWPSPRMPDDSGGFGLLLVERLASRWGVDERTGGGKCVWATVTAADGCEG